MRSSMMHYINKFLRRQIKKFITEAQLKTLNTKRQQNNVRVKPATHAPETGTRNWYQSSGTRNLHVCRSIWYQFFLVPVSVTE